MSSIVDISIFKLLISYVSVLIPLGLLFYFKIKLVRTVLFSVFRMTIQLALVAVYLEWIFKINSWWINLLWVFLMIVIGAYTAVKRIGLSLRYFIFPLFIASLTSVLIVDAFFLGYVVSLDRVFDVQYFIPITGMIIGNSLNHNIVGLSSYFKALDSKTVLYQFLLTNGENQKSALQPFIALAVKEGLNPLIATMSVIGLISLPGMMTGQVLAGASPVLAIKYQIMIMLAIFGGCTINLFLSIFFSNLFVFDGYGRFKKELIV